MYKVRTVAANDADGLARAVEAHINEYAEDVISVSYAIERQHIALLVYRPVNLASEAPVEEAVNVAEHILDEYQA